MDACVTAKGPNPANHSPSVSSPGSNQLASSPLPLTRLPPFLRRSSARKSRHFHKDAGIPNVCRQMTLLELAGRSSSFTQCPPSGSEKKQETSPNAINLILSLSTFSAQGPNFKERKIYAVKVNKAI